MVMKNRLETSTSCDSSNSWSSISISGSTFSNFNYLKTDTYVKQNVDSSSAMLHQGLILNLDEFNGPVAVYGNTFTEVKFGFGTWEDVVNSDKYSGDRDYSSIWSTEDSIMQGKTLFYINVQEDDVEFYDNTFTNCNSMFGLIWIKRESDQNSPILIHDNTFTGNSAAAGGANVLKLEIWNNQDFEVPFITPNMIWAGIQISQNTFQNNVGCYDASGVIEASCYNDENDRENYSDSSYQYAEISLMSSTTSENIQKSGIVDFSTENIVTMRSSGESVDKNKFLMRGNTFTGNFAGMKKTIVFLQGIRRVHMSEDTYQQNSGVFAEALNNLGAVGTIGITTNSEQPGAFTFNSYYIDENEASSISTQANLLDVDVGTLYPDGVVLIDSAFYVELNSLTFHNNYFQEQLPDDIPDSTYRSMALTITRSQGELHLDSLTIQNYFGWDLETLETILGSSEYSNIVTMDPTERDESGNPNTTPTLPEYTIDYAFKGQLITLAYPDTESSEDFKNYFDQIGITTLTVSNITRYDTSNSEPLILTVSDD